MEDTGKLLSALEFAAERHKGQTRKGASKTPYIYHPITVAGLLANVGKETDPDLLMAALLHDTVEDTAKSEDDKQELVAAIRSRYGDRVADIVMEVTDDKSLEKQERKRLQILHAPHKSPEAKKLKIADKISNVREIAADAPLGWSRERMIEYFDWAEKVVAGLRGVNKNLENLFDEVLHQGRKAIAS